MSRCVAILFACWLTFLNFIFTVKIPSEFILTTDRLEENSAYMPSLSNGHLGFTVFGDSIYMNGVYNGYKGKSRRARLPNWLNLTAKLYAEHRHSTIFVELLKSSKTLYVMNLANGYFQWKQTNFQSKNTDLNHTIYNGLSLTQTVYAHRYFNRALIYELFVKRKDARDTLIIKLTQLSGYPTDAFDITPINRTHLKTFTKLNVFKAVTREREHEEFQNQPISLYVIFPNDYNNRRLRIQRGCFSFKYRFILTADRDYFVAIKEFMDVKNFPEKLLLLKHTYEWRNFWKSFRITITGNFELSQIINAGIFYIANSLPSLNTNQLRGTYYGLSPTGLGRGHLDIDYQGHNFWDTEIWMMPIITQFNNIWSQELFQYRLYHLNGARFNANLTGFNGARFPWESAFTGTEVTNECCPEVARQQIHISADIVIALQQYYAMVIDEDWLCEVAWPIVSEIAIFFISRIEWNNNTQHYHINDVMGPDEDHQHVNDNVYTNIMVKRSLEFASFTKTICVSNFNKSIKTQDWMKIADRIYILYDAKRDYHPQYDGYIKGEEVKQADAILLGYPGQLHMTNLTRFNDLTAYESVTRSTGPAMTWSMFAINFLDVGLKLKADKYFTKGFRNYVHPAFKVWSETYINIEKSATNFLTGVGGFLQSILNGYAGIRFHQNSQCSMIIQRTYLPPCTEQLTIHGIKFAGSIFALKIYRKKFAFLFCVKTGKYKIQAMFTNGQFLYLQQGSSIQLKDEVVTIQALTNKNN